MATLLSLSEVSLSFDQRRVLDNISLELNQGEITTLIGPNGAGKSTLVKVILGLLNADSGVITRAPKLKIGYVPQKIAWDEGMPLTAERFLRLASNDAKAKLREVVNLLAIDGLLKRQMARLSGGEMQRVLLARALLREPQLLVLDEPVQGVDISGQVELYQLITELTAKMNFAVLLVSHDLHLVMAGTDQVICLNHHICCKGAPESVAKHPEFARLFAQNEQQQLAVYTHHHQCDDHDHRVDQGEDDD